MSENKYCGNCAHSYAKDMDGYCVCGLDDQFTSCDEVCDNHIMRFDGWIEITPDNVEKLYDKPIAVAWIYEGKTYYSLAGDCTIPLSTMAKHGGYYYYVLPELKIE